MQNIDLDLLQKVTDYETMRKQLRIIAIACMAFGLIAVATGLLFLGQNLLNGLLIPFGLFLIVDGIWLIFSPKATGFILAGIALLTGGILNILVAILNAESGDIVDVFAGLGILQIILGIQNIARYKRFSNVLEVRMEKNLKKQIDGMLKEIRNADPKKNNDIISFSSSSYNQPVIWKARLSPGCGIFTTIGAEEVLFAPPEKVKIVEKGKALIGKSQKIEVEIVGQKIKATIDPHQLERFLTWKEKSPEESRKPGPKCPTVENPFR